MHYLMGTFVLLHFLVTATGLTAAGILLDHRVQPQTVKRMHMHSHLSARATGILARSKRSVIQ